ncbi:MAG TPA: DUF1634 domain-containing protein [Candidatus Acidoferrales bacterium]|nr:DUF1634 domain-containing protein [Candidatus Acidoferrales bacterium]
MAEAKHGWTDERMDSTISVLLRTGVIISSIVVLAGGILYLFEYGLHMPDYRVFQREPASLMSFHRILTGILSWHGRNWIQFGLVLLALTPVARVAFCVFVFLKERDWTYVFLTLIVLSVLVFSFVGR